MQEQFLRCLRVGVCSRMMRTEMRLLPAITSLLNVDGFGILVKIPWQIFAVFSASGHCIHTPWWTGKTQIIFKILREVCLWLRACFFSLPYSRSFFCLSLGNLTFGTNIKISVIDEQKTTVRAANPKTASCWLRIMIVTGAVIIHNTSRKKNGGKKIGRNKNQFYFSIVERIKKNIISATVLF